MFVCNGVGESVILSGTYTNYAQGNNCVWLIAVFVRVTYPK